MTRPPWVTVEIDGVVLHVELEEGKVFTLPLNADGAYALLGELAQRLAELKGNTELQKRIANKAAGWLIDRWAKR